MPPLRIQLCGLVAIERGGRRVEGELPGRQGRLLFVYLVANRDRVATRDELVDALWRDDVPAAPDASLRALLSKLRRVVGADAISGGAEVRLQLGDEVRIDLEAARAAIHRAESAVALGDWSRAWGASQVALFTARRGFLPGEDASWIDEWRRYLDELRLRALECYAAGSLALGGTELAAADRAGRELISLAPYRESGYRHRMQALAAVGNVAEALIVYDELRRLLGEELGVPPSAAAQELHRTLVAATG